MTTNGTQFSKNERKLLGQIVVFRAGRPRHGIVPIIAIGRLQQVRAQTRPNRTLGMVWKVKNREGRVVDRHEVVWAYRDQPEFSIKRYRSENPRPDETAWIEKRAAIIPAPRPEFGPTPREGGES